MNQYELIDTMRGHVDTTTITYKYWTTISFGIIVAAYLVGPDVEAPLVAAMTVIYLLMSISSAGVVRLYTRALAAASGDLEAMRESDDSFLKSSEVLAGSGFRVLKIVGPWITILMIAGSFVVASYLLYRTGFFG